MERIGKCITAIAEEIVNRGDLGELVHFLMGLEGSPVEQDVYEWIDTLKPGLLDYLMDIDAL